MKFILCVSDTILGTRDTVEKKNKDSALKELTFQGERQKKNICVFYTHIYICISEDDNCCIEN